MTTTLIISTYNWTQALLLVLESVKEQSILPDEVIIADDGSSKETEKLIIAFKSTFPNKVSHVWQEDLGFRKTVILNKALKAVTSDYIVQIDGDVILHRHFIKNHITYSEKNTYLYGSRVTLKKGKSSKTLSANYRKIYWHSPGLKRRTRGLYAPFINFSKRQLATSGKLRGCNMSYWKQDALAINGYNEDFVGWGYEDYNFAQRLQNAGVFSKRLKYSGIQFHLYHEPATKGDTSIGDTIQIKTQEDKITKVKNGILKL